MTMINLSTFTFMRKMREHKGLEKYTDASDLQRKAAEIRLSSLTAMTKGGVSGVGASMSAVEILLALYYGQLAGRAVMNFDPEIPGSDEQDYFVLSKGEAVPVQYGILADLGFFDQAEMNFLAKEAALLSMEQGNKVPGVSFSNFADGHGLGVAVGLALSLKMDRKKNRVYVLLGEKELADGQTWEAMMVAAHYRLDNLVCLVDNNGMSNSVMDQGSLMDKFPAFGWRMVPVHDGHDFDKLLDALTRSFTVVNRPTCILCRTVSGKGVFFAEGKPDYHEVALSESELQALISNSVVHG